MRMFDHVEADNDNAPLDEVMLQLVDDWGIYACVSAFLWDGVVAALSRDELTSQEVVVGATYCSEMLRAGTRDLKERLERVHEQMHSGTRVET